MAAARDPRGRRRSVRLRSPPIDGLSDEEVRALFDRARDADYAELAKEARAWRSRGAASKQRRGTRASHQVARLRKRLAQVAAIDFFGAIGREKAEELLGGLEARLSEDEPVAGQTSTEPEVLRDRCATAPGSRAQGIYADRIASAWLIRRFIDPEARFKFVSGKGYRPQDGELRFDMFEAEFTHEGDKCTFEVLLERGALNDSALRAIAEIIHDIDLKDDKFGRAEVAGIKTLIDGIRASTEDDAARIARGTEFFNDLYEYFKKKRR